MQKYYIASTSTYQTDIGPSAFKVMAYLSSCADYKTRECYPKRRTIADKCGISVRTVVRAVKELCEKGLLAVKAQYERYAGDAHERQKENRYILIDAPQMALHGSTAKSVVPQKGAVSENRQYHAHTVDLSSLTATVLKVYNYITFRAGREESCFLSKAEIAAGCGISRITVWRSVKYLVKKGLLLCQAQIRHASSGNYGTACNRFVILSATLKKGTLSTAASIRLIFASIFTKEWRDFPASPGFVTGAGFTDVTPRTASLKNKTQKDMHHSDIKYWAGNFAAKLGRLLQKIKNRQSFA